MPFIGQEPQVGAYHVLDSITASATATYNLQLNGAAFSPASANHLLVSLNGVLQKPGASFNVSGSQITFSSALTSSDNINFIMALGNVLDVGTPTDGSVTNNKIVSMAASKLTGALPALDGSALTNTGSNIIEQLVMLCDGQNYTVGSGTYTSTNVTAVQGMTDTFTDVVGSSISYTAPAGATMVMYEYTWSYDFTSTSQTITHIKSFIDSDEVTSQRQSIQTYSAMNEEYTHTFLIPIGGSANTATGRQASWSGAKTLKIQARRYGSSYTAEFNTFQNWDGSTDTSGQVRKPILRITSLK